MKESKTTDFHIKARALAAKLNPHTTSVQNVDLIAEALEMAFNYGFDKAEEIAANGSN